MGKKDREKRRAKRKSKIESLAIKGNPKGKEAWGLRLKDFNQLAEKYETNFYGVKCGRLRQPIIEKDGVIYGTCSLDWTPCKYKIPLTNC